LEPSDRHTHGRPHRPAYLRLIGDRGPPRCQDRSSTGCTAAGLHPDVEDRRIPTLIATLSEAITLHPGDVIATGTPNGVGIGFDPLATWSAATW
jgi:hypothetical protein